MKLNNKGFSLVELLAVIVILSILMAIMVPSVNYLIDKNKEDNYVKLKEGILIAAKIYLSDNRYDIAIANTCTSSDEKINVTYILGKELTESKLPVQWLIDSKDLTTNSDGNIVNPRNKTKVLDLDNSNIEIKYLCSKKDYSYTLDLKWKNSWKYIQLF